MALLPKVTFEVLAPNGPLVSGTTTEGMLVVVAHEDVPRAKHVDLLFRSSAETFDSRGRRSSEVIFSRLVEVQLPDRLDAGTHRFPFLIELPAGLPPSFSGPSCGIKHEIRTHLEVDWALDPRMKIVANVVLPPREGQLTPAFLRSPPELLRGVVIEVSLASTVLAQGAPLIGKVAMRGGAGIEGDLELAYGAYSEIRIGIGERRRDTLQTRMTVPLTALADGEPFHFEIPAHEFLSPSFTSQFLDHQPALIVTLGTTWKTKLGIAPSFESRLDILPRGSVVFGDAAPELLGNDRLRVLAEAVAAATGLREGQDGALVEGGAGMVRLRFTEVLGEAGLALRIRYRYPDLELGIEFRPLGALEGFRQSPLLPPGFDNFLLRTTRPELGADFFSVFLGRLGKVNELRFSDTTLDIEISLASESATEVIQLAKDALTRAAAITDAVTSLRFPAAVAPAEGAWRALAAEEGAALVPIGPALHDIRLHAITSANEERVFRVGLRTIWKEGIPHDRWTIDMAAPLPEPAIQALLDGHGPAALPPLSVSTNGAQLIMDRNAWSTDPRAQWSVLEAIISWVLDTRGERRTNLPYR